MYYHVLHHARPQHGCYGAIGEELLQHSVATAHIAHSLAAYCNLSAGLVYEAALLLNVGKLLLLDFLDKHFELAQDFDSTHLGEGNLSDLFDYCHVELAGHQLAHWHINPLLSFMVRNQQGVLPKEKASSNEWQLIALLKFSSDCARVLAKGAALPANHPGLLKTPESQLLGLLESSGICRKYLLRLPELI